ncbi:DUF7314 family protein [Halocatena pleomorpha]|uniref:DUF7314 domain-containing protein n=1 Tax=Halocatena pleomorpha TaxID=1785090 RepID=A0A3P3RH89_9EURY|nr:hypothetical protein [Halocatena pleomorpha]RRJ32822.1 hypothetical protein EIK79_03965 [Halocatena pleomorpha]
MADEFMKGFAILTTSMLGWMVIAGWYNTPSFTESQLSGPAPENLQMLDQLALTFKTGLLWFALLGALTFWVLIPAGRELRKAMATE